MTNHYKSYQDRYTYCKPHPKYEYKDCDENKCKKIFKRKCDCPVNETVGTSGDFTLECGNSLKIFQSDEPVEMSANVRLTDDTNEDLCNLKVKVLLHNGNVLEFDIPNPNVTTNPSEENGISFYSKNVCTVTIECESDSGVRCEGRWTFTLPLRGSEKDLKCECPVNEKIGRSNNFTLECGSSLIFFQSDEPTEIFGRVNLEDFSGQNSCDLRVIAELANGDTLEFNIPNPNLTTNPDSSTIAFYSKNVCRVTIECESDS
ncbi:hypothetical protein, partial [Anaeromicrobium sediminis]